MADQDRRVRGLHEKPPSVFARGRYFAVDLRRWDAGRPTMRDPSHPGWPEQGEKTEYEDVAKEWAWDYLRYFQRQQRRRQIGQPPPRPPLSEATDAWIRHREHTVASSTLDTDHAVVGHLLERLGASVRLGRVTKERLQRIFDGMAAEGYAASTLGNYYSTMQAFFGWYGMRDVLDDVTLPNPGRMDPRAWSDAELEKLREAADKVGPSHRLLLEVAVCTGGRRAELCGLRWSDFRPDKYTVRIERQAVRFSTRMKPLKGKRARTALVLPEFWDLYRDEEGYVLGGKEPLRDRTAYHRFIRILEAAGLNEEGVAVHSTRHTYARIMREKGVEPGQLQQFMGHESVTTTERLYDHFGDEAAVRLARGKLYE